MSDERPTEIVPAGKDPLKSNWVDVVTATLKGAAGVIPIGGGFVGELISTAIPRQRLDRVIDTLRRFEEKLDELKSDIGAVQDKLRSEEQLPVLEEVLQQASRAYGQERRQHLANLLAKGVLEVDHARAELLAVLDALRELSDEEVVVLIGYASDVLGPSYSDFVERNQDLLLAHPPGFGEDPEERIRMGKASGLRDYRVNKLVRVGLLKGEELGSSHVTTLGWLLLHFIGLDPEIPMI